MSEFPLQNSRIVGIFSSYKLPEKLFKMTIDMYGLDKANILVQEYFKYIQLKLFRIINNEDQYLTPPIDIDQIWHLHLEDTQSYQEFNQLFNFIPQFTILSHISGGRNNYELTYQLYQQTFKNIDQPEIWCHPSNIHLTPKFQKSYLDIINQTHSQQSSLDETRTTGSNNVQEVESGYWSCG